MKPRKKGSGRKFGSGKNCKILSSLPVGGAIFNLTKTRLESLRQSAYHQGIKVSYRPLGGGLFVMVKQGSK